MKQQDRISLIEYRRQASEENLTAAKFMIEQNKLKIALRDLYYAAFQMVLALFLTQSLQAKTHRNVIQLFGKNFIQTGIFEPQYGRLINVLMDFRNKADYAEYMDITQEVLQNLLTETEEFLSKANLYLDDWLKQNAEK